MYAVTVDMDIFFLFAITFAIGAVSIIDISLNTGIEIRNAVSAGASSRFFPLKSLIKKLAMDFAAPVS